ncbi:MAG TPA: peptidoglycan-binding domain-containing protein [Chloroflexota bacterium]|nr:peptidoglycan-binding domain-containing protein [Chloroflexota bacterium]
MAFEIGLGDISDNEESDTQTTTTIDTYNTTTFNFYDEGSPAAHDAESYGGAAVHHGGHHGDPATLALQQRLLDNGFDPGPLDGIMGARTEAALAAEQATWQHQQQEDGGQHEAHRHHHEATQHHHEATQHHHAEVQDYEEPYQRHQAEEVENDAPSDW